MSDFTGPVLVAAIMTVPNVWALWQNRKYVKAQAEKEQAETIKTKAETGGTSSEKLKAAADAAEQMSVAWNNLNMANQREISDLRAEVATLRTQVTLLTKQLEQFDEIFSGANRLYHQLKSHTIEPVYKPPDRRNIVNMDAEV